MIKIANISSRDLLEVKRKRCMGIKYAIIKRTYNISYNDIKNIVRHFSECEFEDDVNKKLEEINSINEQCRIIDYKGNYQKYKTYYKSYSKDQYQRRKSS